MSFVREYPSQRRRRGLRAPLSFVVLGLSAWLVLGLISQVVFQLIG